MTWQVDREIPIPRPAHYFFVILTLPVSILWMGIFFSFSFAEISDRFVEENFVLRIEKIGPCRQ